MATTRSRRGDRTPTDRKHVGMTLPRPVKEQIVAAAAILEWSVGDWILAVAAEHGPAVVELLRGRGVRRRPTVEDATFTALYLTADERDELDDQARACGLNRSAFVTAVAQVGLGESVEDAVSPLLAPSD